MSVGYSIAFTLVSTALTGVALFYKMFLHRKYYDEILSLRGKHSFRSEENNIFTGEPLWKQKASSSQVTPEQRFDTEIFSPTFKPQNIDNKTDKLLRLEKRIRITLIVFYISVILMVLSLLLLPD